MKIQKYNEKVRSQEQKEFDIFIELIIKKFCPDDDLGNMGSYECERLYLGSKSYIRSSFYFMIIDDEELILLQDILKYFRKFDSTTKMFIRKMDKDVDAEMIECNIDIQISAAYSEIYKDLERNEDAKKYNL